MTLRPDIITVLYRAGSMQTLLLSDVDAVKRSLFRDPVGNATEISRLSAAERALADAQNTLFDLARKQRLTTQ